MLADRIGPSCADRFSSPLLSSSRSSPARAIGHASPGHGCHISRFLPTGNGFLSPARPAKLPRFRSRYLPATAPDPLSKPALPELIRKNHAISMTSPRIGGAFRVSATGFVSRVIETRSHPRGYRSFRCRVLPRCKWPTSGFHGSRYEYRELSFREMSKSRGEGLGYYSSVEMMKWN